MVDQKQGISIKWIILFVVCLIIVDVWVNMSKHKQIEEPKKSTVIITDQSDEEKLDAKHAEPSNFKENMLNANKEDQLISEIDQSSGQTHFKGKGQVEQDLQENKQLNHGRKINVSRAANLKPEQQAILAKIKENEQQRELVTQAVQQRKDKIESVHQAIMDSGIMNAHNPNKKIDEPILTVPDDIAQKIKSHQLTAH